MRNATKQERDSKRKWTIKVSWINPENSKKKQKLLGPYSGEEQKAKFAALAEAVERFSYATDFTVVETECEWDESVVFFWDWKQLPEKTFFKDLDKQLSSFGCQVIHLESDGCYIWFIGEK